MNKKPQEANQSEAIFDHVIMIKSYKEHIEEQSEKLIQFFEEETKFDDPLKLIGWRYGQKDREFESLRKENNGLKIHTRKIEQELANLRCSLNNTQHLENDYHLEQVEQQPSSTINNKTNFTSTYLGTEDILQQMHNIKLMKQEADEDYSQYKQKYDQLLQYLFKSLSQSATAHQLKKEMQPASSADRRNEQEMVLVPKIRYEKLIQIYSMNMAEISAKEIKAKISTVEAQSVATHLDYIEQQKKQYREDYSDIVKDASIDLKDLGNFFKALARKVGFEGEWDRYHQKNENEAIALKGKIDAIMKSYQIEPVNKPDDYVASPQLMRTKLTLKLNALINVLSFDKREKQIWADLSEKIKQDELLDFTNIFAKSQLKLQQQGEQQQKKIASFLAYSLKNCAEHLETLLAGRINAKVLSLHEVDDILELSSLHKEIKAKLLESEEGDVWKICRDIVDSKMEDVVKILKKSLVFMPHGEIYRTYRNK